MKRNVWIGLLAVLAIGAAGYRLARGCHSPPSVRVDAFHGLAAVLAEETANLISQQGLVALIPEERQGINNAFQTALRNYDGVRLVTATLPDPALPGVVSFSEDELAAIVEAYPDADVIVSLRGMPPFSRDALARRTGRQRRYVALYSSGVHTNSFQRDIPVDLAIVPKPPIDPSEANPRSQREWFDCYYAIVRRQP